MLGINDTDNEWRKWAEYDPLYAILSDSKYRNQQNVEDFFESGEVHFNGIIHKFNLLGFPLNNHRQSIDYGCGVGRVLRPMADYFDYAMGIDIAPTMLYEAEKHLTGKGVILKLFDGKDLDSCLGQRTYEFIHSALVLQHIRPRRGLWILENLLRHLNPGGKAYIQLPVYAETKSHYFINQIVTCHPVILKLSRRLLMKKEYQNDPVMQMNVYPPGRLLSLFHRNKVKVISLDVTKDRKNALLIAEWYLVRD